MMVPLAALAGLIASFVVIRPLNSAIHYVLWETGRQMPGKMFLLYVLPYDGAVAAVLFVLFGTWAAPTNRQMASIWIFMIGLIIAWYCVGEFYSPEGTPNDPIRVWSPFVGTCLGGIIGCILAHVLFRPRNRSATVV